MHCQLFAEAGIESLTWLECKALTTILHDNDPNKMVEYLEACKQHSCVFWVAQFDEEPSYSRKHGEMNHRLETMGMLFNRDNSVDVVINTGRWTKQLCGQEELIKQMEEEAFKMTEDMLKRVVAAPRLYNVPSEKGNKFFEDLKKFIRQDE